MSSPFKLLPKQINESSLLCRGCLAELGEMKNMHEWCLADDFYIFSEIQLNTTDSLSALLCTKCEKILQTCKDFRLKCQQSNETLKNILFEETKQPTTPDTNFIDYILTEEKLIYMITPPNKDVAIILPCPFKCNNVYNSKNMLLQHLTQKHNVKSDEFNIELQFNCMFVNCNYHIDSYSYFSSRALLNNHCELHELKDYQCVGCMASFNKESDYVNHMRECKVSQNEQIATSVSETAYNHKDNTFECTLLENHLTMKICAPNTESKLYLPCPYVCKNSYIKKKDLLSHLRKQHHKSESFSISLQYYCSKSDCSYNIKSSKDCYFNERKFLNQHYTKRHKNKSYHCIECSSNFSSETEFNRHKKHCNMSFVCEACSKQYKTHERWLVHLMRKHPELHKKYKDSRKSYKRKSPTSTDSKKLKTENEKFNDFCDSPKRSFATQTNPYTNIRNDVTLPSWTSTVSTKKDEISTQTGFEDILSLKSQNSEDDSLFFSETVSLSDIQTQTVPFEFGLSRSDKETITSHTQPEFTIKETQTCVCMYESPKPNFRLFDSFSSSPVSSNLTSTETQTAHVGLDNVFTLNSIETQTCFDENL